MRCAEQSGLTAALGRWVFREITIQAPRWQDRGFISGRIAVNMSAPELREANFVENVERCLAVHGIAPSRIQIELTASTPMAFYRGFIRIQQVNQHRA